MEFISGRKHFLPLPLPIENFIGIIWEDKSMETIKELNFLIVKNNFISLCLPMQKFSGSICISICFTISIESMRKGKCNWEK
jgi:hypothetical protein